MSKKKRRGKLNWRSKKLIMAENLRGADPPAPSHQGGDVKGASFGTDIKKRDWLANIKEGGDECAETSSQ